MGHVQLLSETELGVSVESAADLAAVHAAFRATPGSDPLPLRAGQEECRVNIENFSNVCALWACGFAWENRALEAIINKLMPMAQRRAVMRASTAEIQAQGQPERIRRPAG